MAKELKKRERDFCKYKAQGYSDVESAVKAGYSPKYAKTDAHKIREKHEIKKEIGRLTEKTAEIADKNFVITIEQLLKELNNLKLYGMKEEELNDKDGQPTGRKRKIDTQCALSAIEKQAKIIGAFEEDNKQKGIIVTERIIYKVYIIL